MRVERLADPDRLDEAAGAFLRAREAEHNLLLGILAELRDADRPADGPPPYLAVTRDDAGRVGLVALRTPPRNLVLSTAAAPEAVDPLAADLVGDHADLPGVTAPSALASRFAARWQEATGRPGRLHMSMRVFRADRARRPASVAGSLRPATTADRATVTDWVRAFQLEALGEPADDRRLAGWVEGMLRPHRDRGLVLWEVDGVPVSVAGFGGPTPNGVRLIAVYTPPPLRRRGYATACVAALTERLLAGGRRFCFLFTDLANPTSNAIYERIGYRPVVEVDDRRFDDPRSPGGNAQG